MNNSVISRNDIAEKLLKQLGIIEPSSEQFNVIEQFVLRNIEIRKVIYSNKLSERETSCLHLTAQGKTSKEIAEILNIKRTTVSSYKRSVMKKLKCSSMAQSVFKAFYFDHFNFLINSEGN